MKIRAAAVSDGEMLAMLATYDWIAAYGEHGVGRALAAHVAGELSPARYRSRLLEKGRMIWVLEQRRRLVGFAEVLLRATHSATAAATSLDKFVLHGAVDSEETRAMLFQHVLAELGKYRISAVWLTLWHQHKAALQFYTECGFRQVGEFFLEIDGEHHTHYILDNTPS